jgi:hypothetical protein
MVSASRPEFRAPHAHHHQRRGPPLDGLGHVLADALEGVAAVALDLRRHDLDVDAGQRLGQRPAARRLAPFVLAHLFDRGLVLGADHRRGCGAVAEHLSEHDHRQLRFVRRQALALGPEDAALELAALLERLQIQLAIMLDVGAELRDLVSRRLVVHDDGTVAIVDRESRSHARIFDAREQRREHGAVNAHARGAGGARRHDKERPVQPLVK